MKETIQALNARIAASNLDPKVEELRKQLARANDAQSVKRALEPMAGKLREDAEELRVKVLAELEAPAVPAGTPPKSPEQK